MRFASVEGPVPQSIDKADAGSDYVRGRKLSEDQTAKTAGTATTAQATSTNAW